eukprot:COSAG01_NODE_7387_length_3228_cov_17.737935_1_plen_60_part_00
MTAQMMGRMIQSATGLAFSQMQVPLLHPPPPPPPPFPHMLRVRKWAVFGSSCSQLTISC